MSNSEKPEIKLDLPDIITESIKTYPRGRGKVLIIAEKSVKPKPKRRKKNPSFLWKSIKSNPSNINLVEYANSNDNIKRIYLFAGKEMKQLSFQERYDLAIVLLASCVTFSTKLTQMLGFSHSSTTINKKIQKSGRLDRWGLSVRQIKKDVLEKLKGYVKWRVKN